MKITSAPAEPPGVKPTWRRWFTPDELAEHRKHRITRYPDGVTSMVMGTRCVHQVRAHTRYSRWRDRRWRRRYG